MSERYLRLGVPPDYFEHARHFEHVARQWRWGPHEIDRAIQFVATYNGRGWNL